MTDNKSHDEVTELVTQVNDFLNQTEEARALSERDRDYYDGKQWTEDQIKVMNGRRQAPIVVNRIKPKVKGIKGLMAMRATDPKAYPRTPKHEDAAHAVTDALRYVADNNDFQDMKLLVTEEVIIEGYNGAVINVTEDPNGEISITVEHVPYDRIYFDPHSRKKDFSDAKYMGYVTWMSAEVAAELFDRDIDDFQTTGEDDGDETLDDRPHWYGGSTDNLRVRIATHFFIEDGIWKKAVFTGDIFLVEVEESPFLDEFDQPSNPMELISIYVDRENNRYGEVRSWIDQQDEMNHRRSKALHLLSQRQTAGRRGAIKDVTAMKRELSKADGHVPYDGEKGDFEILSTGDMASGQFELYQDAKEELDAISFNAQLSGERQGDLSGVAIDKLQTAGTLELNDIFGLLNSWEKRVYRQIWNRVRQFWDEEKWIRVTDDQKNLKWVGLNHKVTAQAALEERIEDESLPIEERQVALVTLQLLMKDAPERLQEVIEVRNDTNDLDVDIIIEQSFDSVNVQQEQFKLLATFAGTGEIDIVELIELSEIRGKDEVIEKIEQRRSAAAQAGSNIAEVTAMNEQAQAKERMASAELKEQQAIEQQLKNLKTMNGTEDAVKLNDLIADVQKKNADTTQKQVETEILITQPIDKSPQIVV